MSRIDHGVRCIEDSQLVKYLIEQQVPLTVCPLSNIKLCVFDSMEKHNIKQLLHMGLCVTVNSDDPSYFGGYIAENLQQIQVALGLSQQDIYQMMKNSFQATFLSPEEKRAQIAELDDFMTTISV